LTFDHSSRKKGLFGDDCENWVVRYGSMCVYSTVQHLIQNQNILYYCNLEIINGGFFFFLIPIRGDGGLFYPTYSDSWPILFVREIKNPSIASVGVFFRFPVIFYYINDILYYLYRRHNIILYRACNGAQSYNRCLYSILYYFIIFCTLYHSYIVSI